MDRGGRGNEGEDNKMRKMAITFLSVLLIASGVQAAEVWVTPKGDKYHMATCPLIKNKEVVKMEQADAEKKGLKACTRCFKSAEKKTMQKKQPKLLKTDKE